MKRLIVCCDGTWQKLTNEYPTNVVKITQAIKSFGNDGNPQLLYYSEGVGTGDLVDKLGGGAFGWGLDNVIQNAYRFLCLNYDLGDEIYLFGFSRGSYTVRSLAGLIYNVGLLKRQYIRETPAAYDFYRDRSDDTKPNSIKAKNFRTKYSQEVNITFLGCWDTVGSLGIPDQIPFFPIDNLVNRKYQFHDTQINRRIQHARHAVAIDERRKVFYVTPMHKSDGAEQQDLKQVWFPGEHGCVGGGTEKHRQLSDAALEWMMEEAAEQGLSFQRDTIEGGIVCDPTTPFDNSPTGIFAGLGVRVRKLSDDRIYSHPDPSLDPEKLEYVYATFDDLHESTKKRWCLIKTYRPEGLKVFETRLNDLC
ncbi:DUF2235 domain-containing protein [Merismopedia glauca]|uniref:DUF2235 domain-containing protein n=1 Tax=Merismopedia glauca CCAP 1448/3 TaxID=1296344 RepID=A0A2T1C0F4_9CYAN|nr:DUF2235 domain-containing protein [Merismopedia glauca]PSB01648.1 DUF2235 domain-containing protein [Merismopedia glauca CCAP 1448/3]